MPGGGGGAGPVFHELPPVLKLFMPCNCEGIHPVKWLFSTFLLSRGRVARTSIVPVNTLFCKYLFFIFVSELKVWGILPASKLKEKSLVDRFVSDTNMTVTSP
nr:hypothetical protein Iba_chr09bCG6330 [Ipomoea batatas]